MQVLFLGADFDAFTDAQNVGVASSSTITASGAAGLRTTLDAVARETKAFASGMVASMEFSEADREAARDDSLRSWDGRRATRLNLSFASRLPAVLAAHVLQQTKSPGSGANGPGCLRISASYTTGLG